MLSPHNSPCGPSLRRTDRGSAVITALVLAAVTAVLVSGFLFRSAQEAKMATRSFYESAALNLAEAAVEEAMFSVNTGIATAGNGWTVPSDSSTSLVRTVNTGFNYGQGTGAFYLRIDGIGTSTVTLTVASAISIPNQRPIVKQLRMRTTKRQVWSGGVVAKGGVTMNGSNNIIDGYDSTHGSYDAVNNRTDKGSICAQSVSCGQNAGGSVYGYATHAASTQWPNSCTVKGATTPNGVSVDPTRMRTDYNVNLANSTPPTRITRELNHVWGGMTLPRNGDTPDPTTGRYHYHCTGIDINDYDTLNIQGPCDIICDGDVNCQDNSKFTVGAAGSNNPSFCLYTSHNVNLYGRGIDNQTGSPSKVSIWGTCDSNHSQSVQFRCNGQKHLCGVYVPNGSVRCDDDEIHGSVVCNTLTLNGNAKCHYDTQLANIAADPNGDNNAVGTSTLKLTAWAELKDAPNSGTPFARDNRAPFNNLF